MFERIGVVFAKEVIDNLRDRRSVTMAFFYPFVGPVLIGALIALVGQAITELPTSELTLPVRGADAAPQLVQYLEDNGVRIVPAPEDPALALRSGEHAVALIIPGNFGERFGAERTATVQLVTDGSRLSAVLVMSRALTLLQTYNREVATARLEAHGVDPAAAEPMRIENVNVAVGHSLTGFFLNMMPPFMIFTIFIGGVYLAIDTTSGERERGSLEPLLTNPIARWELMTGKVGAALLFTATALAVQLLAFGAMFTLISEGAAGVEGSPDAMAFFAVFAIAAPLMLLAVAVQVIIATVTRSFKETQTYLGLLPLLPSLPGMALVFIAFKGQHWMMAIPTFGQTLLFGQLVRGEPLNAVNVALASGVTAGVAVALLLLAARLYRRERLLFTG
ncbi:MAG: ABC transporter permease [Alphaproteobacteria bacterium]